MEGDWEGLKLGLFEGEAETFSVGSAEGNPVGLLLG